MASLIITTLVGAGLLIMPPSGPEFSIDIPVPGFELSIPAPRGQMDAQAPRPRMRNFRNACDAAVSKALAMTGGELLSVEPARNGRPICKVTVLVINKNGRPRKVKLRIPMDL
jgi:hypothetical protein